MGADMPHDAAGTLPAGGTVLRPFDPDDGLYAGLNPWPPVSFLLAQSGNAIMITETTR